MPREYCRVCQTFRTLTSEHINRVGYFACPGCETHLQKAKATHR